MAVLCNILVKLLVLFCIIIFIFYSQAYQVDIRLVTVNFMFTRVNV